VVLDVSSVMKSEHPRVKGAGRQGSGMSSAVTV
jgi:hypothetical protein